MYSLLSGGLETGYLSVIALGFGFWKLASHNEGISEFIESQSKHWMGADKQTFSALAYDINDWA